MDIEQRRGSVSSASAPSGLVAWLDPSLSPPWGVGRAGGPFPPCPRGLPYATESWSGEVGCFPQWVPARALEVQCAQCSGVAGPWCRQR